MENNQIKRSGKFIAVKVQEGGRNFRKEDTYTFWDFDGWNGVDMYVYNNCQPLEFEIIGLISEIIKVDPAEFHDFAAVEAMGEMFKDEARADWNQWLIIKTEGE
jgi:hypothetical protein